VHDAIEGRDDPTTRGVCGGSRRRCPGLSATDSIWRVQSAGDAFRILVQFRVAQGRVDLLPLPAEISYRRHRYILDETPIGLVRSIILPRIQDLVRHVYSWIPSDSATMRQARQFASRHRVPTCWPDWSPRFSLSAMPRPPWSSEPPSGVLPRSI